MSAKLDLTIANDIATFRNDAHPVWAIDADDAEFIDGPRERVAQRLATTILTRAGHTLHPVDPRTHGLWFTDHDADTPTQEKWATVTRDILRGAKHAGHDPSRWRIEPILYSGQLIGGVGRRGQRAAPLILPEARNEGHGQRLINHLGEVGLELTTTAPYVDWFIARGYQIVSRNAHGARLRPPHGRSDLRTAASVCLFCSHTRQVLVGQRQRSPKSGWWALPGGHQEPAEDLATTAARELLEETGIDIPTGPPALQYSSFSGCDDGKTAWNITTHVHDVPTPIATRPSPELVAQWMTLDQALKLDPLTTGTRQVLLAVSEHWPALRSTDTS